MLRRNNSLLPSKLTIKTYLQFDFLKNYFKHYLQKEIK